MTPANERWIIRDGRGEYHYVDIVSSSLDDQLYLLRTLRRLSTRLPQGLTLSLKVDELI